MPMTIQDVIADRFHGQSTFEESADVSSSCLGVGETIAKKFFPNFSFPHGEVTFFPFVLVNAWPTRNLRGRSFTPETLKSSAETAHSGFVNHEHIMCKNGFANDRIVGHIAASLFQPPVNELANSSTIDRHSGRIVCLGAIYNATKFYSELASSRTDEWKTSAEWSHQLVESCIAWDDNIIPVTEAPEELLRCIEQASMTPYKGHQTTLLCGAMTNRVIFKGSAFTKSPADSKAKIFGVYIPGELASKPGRYNHAYSAIELNSTYAECASMDEIASKLTTELGAFEVIGQTNEADGHSHSILADGTVMPLATDGHSHYIHGYNLVTGSKPSFQGKTGVHTTRIQTGPETFIYPEHFHTFDIPLKSRPIPTPAETPATITEIANMNKTLEALLAKLSEKVGKDTETQALLAEIRQQHQKDEIASTVLADAIQRGDVVTKAVAADETRKAVESAVAELTAKHARESLLASRMTELANMGIDVEKPLAGQAKPVKDLLAIATPDKDDPIYAMLRTLAQERASASNQNANQEKKATQTMKPAGSLFAAGANGTTGSSKPLVGKHRAKAFAGS